jgi:hypothetical protein
VYCEVHNVVTKRFLDVGSPLITTAMLLKRVQHVTITNPQDLTTEALPIGTFGRIHSVEKSVYTVWLLEEAIMKPIIVKVPADLMSTYFRQQPHNIFPHFA